MPIEPHAFADRIHIEQLEVSTRIGVPEEERAAPQRLAASISFWPYHEADDLADKIENVVNYSAVADEVKNFVRDQSVNLIETLADRLAIHLLKHFRIQKITLELRKFPFEGAKYVSVTVTRTTCVE
jgi:dihydroneopterin aldolase